MGWAHLQIRPITNSKQKRAVPLSAVKSSASINLYESRMNLYFSFFKIFHDGPMTIRISLLLRNLISFLGKPECEETSINSNSQYKQVSRDTPEPKMYNPPHFIHIRHQLSMQQILTVYAGCLHMTQLPVRRLSVDLTKGLRS